MFHDSFPEIYEGLLSDLYNDPKIKWPQEGLCAFSALTGKNWKDGEKVVFYGWALNGWVPPLKFRREDLGSDDKRSQKAIEICVAGHKASICKLDEDVLAPACEDCDDPQLHWVHHQRKKPYRYNSVAVTPFWSVIGKVLHGLDPARAADPNWASWIAWSNLYKVAPARGGNPGGPLMRCQFGKCAELLKVELANWQARAAVFLTEENKRSGGFDCVDLSGWFEPFRRSLQIDDLRPLPEALRKGRVLVYKGSAQADGHPITIVVALRPENLSREELSDQIITAIGSAR
jgi:hypothetical protein